MILLRKSFLTLIVLGILVCKSEKQEANVKLISEKDIISLDLSVIRFDIHSIEGKLATGEFFDGYLSLICPSFPSSVSISVYLSDSLPERLSDVVQNNKAILQIYPSSITCMGEFSSDVSFYIPQDVSPNSYFLISRFELSVTQPFGISSEIYMVRSVEIIQNWEDFSVLSKNIKNFASLRITDIVDVKTLAIPEDSLRIFAVSQNKKLYVVDLKDITDSLTVSVNLFDLKIENPYELEYFEIQDGYIILVNDEDKKSTEFLKISKDLSLSFSQVVTGYRKFNILLERSDGIYLISQGCDNSVVIYGNTVSDLAIPLCDFATRKQDTIFIFRSNEVGLMSQNSLTYVIIPEADYIIDAGNKYLIYSRSGISIDVYSLDHQGLKLASSINITRAPVFSEYLPISESSLMLLYNYGNSMTLYVWNKEQKIALEKTLPHLETKHILSKDSKLLVWFQKETNSNIFIFDSGNFVEQVSGEISGDVIDFYYDSGILVLFIKLANRLGLYYKVANQNFVFTQGIVQRYKIINISPDTFIIFYTDSAGCWEKRLCKGKESAFIFSKGLWREQDFFVHSYPIYQRLVDIIPLKERILLIFQDLDYIRFFSL